MKYSHTLVANNIANELYLLGDGRHVPHSVRYGAADKAVAEVLAWLTVNRPADTVDDTVDVRWLDSDSEGER